MRKLSSNGDQGIGTGRAFEAKIHQGDIRSVTAEFYLGLSRAGCLGH
jgi:hypothetical protein